MAAAPKLPELPTVPLSLVEEALKELQNLQKYRAEHHKKHHQKQERRPVNIEIERYLPKQMICGIMPSHEEGNVGDIFNLVEMTKLSVATTGLSSYLASGFTVPDGSSALSEAFR